VFIYILDSGITADHELLHGKVSPLQPKEPYLPNRASPDRAYHGTAVASVAHLVAPDARIIDLEILDLATKTESMAVKAQRFARAVEDVVDDHVSRRDGATDDYDQNPWRGSVINISLDFEVDIEYGYYEKEMQDMQPFEEAMRRAAKEGIRMCGGKKLPFDRGSLTIVCSHRCRSREPGHRCRGYIPVRLRSSR